MEPVRENRWHYSLQGQESIVFAPFHLKSNVYLLSGSVTAVRGGGRRWGYLLVFHTRFLFGKMLIFFRISLTAAENELGCAQDKQGTRTILRLVLHQWQCTGSVSLESEL